MEHEEPGRYFECPILLPLDREKCFLAASIVDTEWKNKFTARIGTFDGTTFQTEYEAPPEYGPDQYAPQTFKDAQGRLMEITWVPGWQYQNYGEKSLGCLSLPREITVQNGKLLTYPIAEVQHVLQDTDPLVTQTGNGFVVKRKRLPNVLHEGKVLDLKILRDGYVLEIFVNKGEFVYSVFVGEEI